MKIKQFAMAASVFILMGTLCAKETVSYNQKAKWESSRFLVQNDTGISLKKSTFVLSKIFPVDLKKKYTINYTVLAKNLPKNEKLTLNVGFFLYDAKNRPIFCQNICAVNGSFAKVLVSAKKGEKILIVDKSSKMFARPWHNLAINAKEDMSDLPNRNIISSNVKSVVKKDNGWEMTFAAPFSKDVPAGTTIRLQSTGGYLGTGGNGIVVTADPKTISGSIQGVAPKGVWTKYKWPVGTVKAKLFIQPYTKAKDAEIVFKNISIDIE